MSSATTAATATPATALPRTAPGFGRLRWLLGDSLVMAGRSLAHIRQIPEKLIDVTVQPLMFVLLFAFVFGEVIGVPGGGDYHEYLIGGILVQTLVFGMMGPGVSIATDLGEGILDRFRSLPMLRPAYLLGHLTAEFASTVLAIVIMVATGFLVGWGIHSSPDRSAGRVRPAGAARRHDALAGDADRRPRPLARRRPGDRLPRHLPAHLRLLGLRPGHGPAGRAAASSPNSTR